MSDAQKSDSSVPPAAKPEDLPVRENHDDVKGGWISVSKTPSPGGPIPIPYPNLPKP